MSKFAIEISYGCERPWGSYLKFEDQLSAPSSSRRMSALDGVNGTFCDAKQSQQSISIDNDSTILTNGQSIGLAASFISLGAIIIVFILIKRNQLHYRQTVPNGDWRLLQTPTDIYMLSLFTYDILQAIGGVVTTGVIKQIGELGVALITLILTAHTFTTALWGVGAGARYFSFGAVTLTCLFTVLWVGISNGIHKNFETPTPYWCWIGPKYEGERLAGEYLWVWIALFATAVMYVPVHFWVKGELSVDDKKWYKFRRVKSDVEDSQRRATLGFFLYPLAYSLLVIPLSISQRAFGGYLFGIIMFNLSGALNVLLFLKVRPHRLLVTPPEDPGEPGADVANQPTGTGLMDDV
ncbi:hypothetical protein EI94DRAFT_1740602 [Lactarius quietus]|nr:hypothetical protein EI94DRAFT_1740602 [Lactarius quietus]